MYKVPEKYRIGYDYDHPYASEHGEMFGLFFIPTPIKDVVLFCMASCGDDQVPWEHVSVSLKKITKGKTYDVGRCPTWEEMCKVKDLFWDGTDTVVQFHPPESEYVSQHHHCLHLWRKRNENFETPPSITVGTQIGQKV
jgi:hypothetical protein